MSVNKKFKTVDEYIESQPIETQRTLHALRAIIKKTVPNAIELFNYDIPAYALVKDGKRDKQIMIAAYKTFVGFYPGAGILDHFSKELVGYKVAKASVQFENTTPLPENLIVKIIQYKMSRSIEKGKTGKKY